MTDTPTTRTRPWAGLGLSQLLALVLLAGCLWWVARELEYLLPNHRITAALSLDQALGSVLIWQLSAFGAVLLLCHLALGLLAFGLARLTEAALPGAAPARRGWLVAGWFAALAAAVLAGNATWYPSSQFTHEDSWLRVPAAGLYPAEWLLLAMALAVILLGLRAAPRLKGVLTGRAAAAAGGAVLAAMLVYWLSATVVTHSRAAAAGDGPHVVIIGIDSLRNDLRVPRGGAADAPHLRAFLEGAHRFTDTISPLARTYPAWVSILTGRHPVTTNARYNLMSRSLVQTGGTLGDALGAHGYRRTYATDEVRFANIDESFGFDRLITPPIGAVDFLLGYAGDIPLVNLIAATPAGRLLFPSNTANRAAFVTYRPDHYLKRLERELVIEGPSFMTIHLTLAHWPYAWAGMGIPNQPQEYRHAYARAVAEVDRQFNGVLQLLQDKGVLDNAVVVLLSDHGEALGDQGDTMLRRTGSHHEIWKSLWGHGTSVLSPHQYGVLLAMRAYGRAQLPGSAGDHDWPVSLEDVRPTLEQFATGVAPADVDGVSLLPLLADPAAAAALASRVRFTETDFNTPSSLAGKYEASGLVNEAAGYYELEPDSGWVQIKGSRLHELFTRKQRAALSSRSLLAAVPDDAGGFRYLFTDRREPFPRPLAARPDPGADAEAARLWDALQARFPGELPTRSRLP